MNSKTITIIFWVVVIGAAFAYSWYKGYLLKFRDYWNNTVEEMRKCTWPTWDELKGSTVVVSISIALLSAFTFLVDEAFAHFVRFI